MPVKMTEKGIILPKVKYIITNNTKIEAVEIIKETKDFSVLRIKSTGQGLRLRNSKIFDSENEANEELERRKEKSPLR